MNWKRWLALAALLGAVAAILAVDDGYVAPDPAKCAQMAVDAVATPSVVYEMQRLDCPDVPFDLLSTESRAPTPSQVVS